jgi:hypothetical protein
MWKERKMELKVRVRVRIYIIIEALVYYELRRRIFMSIRDAFVESI